MKKIETYVLSIRVPLCVSSLIISAILIISMKKWGRLLENNGNNSVINFSVWLVLICFAMASLSFLSLILEYSQKKGPIFYLMAVSLVSLIMTSVALIFMQPVIYMIIGFTISAIIFSFTSVETLIPSIKNIKKDYSKEISLKDKLPIIINLIVFILGLLIGK